MGPDYYLFFLGFWLRQIQVLLRHHQTAAGSAGGQFVGHTCSVSSCAVSSDGSRVASCSEVVAWQGWRIQGSLSEIEMNQKWFLFCFLFCFSLVGLCSVLFCLFLLKWSKWCFCWGCICFIGCRFCFSRCFVFVLFIYIFCRLLFND